MRYFLLCMLILCTLPTFSVHSSRESDKRFRVLEYNTENLFDTVHDSAFDDYDFLPDGEYHWNSYRYWRKEGNLARVILEAGGLQPVDVIGFCEVENDSVIRDLFYSTRLASLGYEFVVTHSSDLRGIDVALAYQPETYRLIAHQSYSVPYDSVSERPTRDILWCSGVVPTGDTLDIFLVHFPSRRGGAYLTDAYRERAARVVREKADSLRKVRQYAKIVFMGDCNAEPREKCLRILQDDGFFALSAHAKAINPSDATDDRSRKDIKGTYYYQKTWSRIDNIFVNSNLLDSKQGLHVGKNAQSCLIFAPSYLLEDNADGYFMPFRAYRGPSYHGGVSDHLPLLLDLWY